MGADHQKGDPAVCQDRVADKHGERLHTIYLEAAPEYGKERFFARMQRDIDHVKSRYPKALFVGIADGAKANWDFLGPHIDEQVPTSTARWVMTPSNGATTR